MINNFLLGKHNVLLKSVPFIVLMDTFDVIDIRKALMFNAKDVLNI